MSAGPFANGKSLVVLRGPLASGPGGVAAVGCCRRCRTVDLNLVTAVYIVHAQQQGALAVGDRCSFSSFARLDVWCYLDRAW